MKLNVFERLALLNVLPKQGNFVTLKIIRELKEDLSFDEKEIKELELTVDSENGNATWNPEKDKGKEIEIGGQANKVIVEALEKLDKQNKMTENHMSLYEKFIGGDSNA